MLKSKPRDDRFPDHIISQTGIHTPKSGVLFRQVLASGLPQSDRFPTTAMNSPSILRFCSRITLFSSVSSPIPSRKEQPLQSDSNGQVQKPLANIPPLKEIIFQPLLAQALESFQSFQTIPRVYYVMLVILLCPPWFSF